MELVEKIITIRTELQKSVVKKSGKNKQQGFEYYELADFLPTLNELMKKYGVIDVISFEKEKGIATLELTDGKTSYNYSIPFELFETPVSKSGYKLMQDIQYLGAQNTYYKRYLYLNAFGITDGEVIDSMDNNDLGNKKEPKQTPKKEKTIFKTKFTNLIKDNNLDMNEMAIKYGLNKTSTDEDFQLAFVMQEKELKNGK